MTHVDKIRNLTAGLIEDIKDKEFDAVSIILFGSVVKGSLHPKSDIDICIVTRDGELDYKSAEDSVFKNRIQIQSYFDNWYYPVCDVDYIYADMNRFHNGTGVFASIRQEGRVLWTTTGI